AAKILEVVSVQKGFGFEKRPFPVRVYRDAIVQNSFESFGISPLFDEHLSQPRCVVLEQRQLDLVRHPTVRMMRNPAQGTLNSTFPDAAGAWRTRDIDGARLLRGFREEIHIVKVIILAVKARVFV